MKRTLSKALSRLNVVIVAHIFATGPALDLEDYLQKKVRKLLFIGHPFSYRDEINSFYRLYNRGNLTIEHKAYPWRLPEVFWYLKDALYTVLWVLRFPGKVNLYIGSDNFSAFLGLLLRRLGKIENVVLYTIDYMPQRFSNPILNFVYHFFDRQCLKHCQAVWNVSPVMTDAREKYSGLRQDECAPQIVVPLGMWYKRILKLDASEKKRYQLVFMGHILEKQGLDVVISAMPLVIRKIPKAKLLIIGTGGHENYLKNLVKKLKISKNVEFTGYIEKHEDIEKMLVGSTIAIAMYRPDPTSFTQWADPGKLKNYLAAGLPVVLTRVPPIAREIEKRKCGVIAEYTVEDFARKILALLRNKKKLLWYSKNARKFAAQFDWDRIFSRALKESI